jgi:hypothetical protein
VGLQNGGMASGLLTWANWGPLGYLRRYSVVDEYQRQLPGKLLEKKMLKEKMRKVEAEVKTI